MPIVKDIQLIEFKKILNFEFMVEIACYDIIMSPVTEAFQSHTIITDDNKRILPAKIFNRIQFFKGEGYRITGGDITLKDDYIIQRLEMSMVEYINK